LSKGKENNFTSVKASVQVNTRQIIKVDPNRKKKMLKIFKRQALVKV